MAQADSTSAAASNSVTENNSDCAQQAEPVDWFPRLFVLYAVTTLTGTTLKIVQKLGIDRLLQHVTPTLRAALALLTWVTSLGRREPGRSVVVDNTVQIASRAKRAYVFYSAINVTESIFSSVGYRPADFPFEKDEDELLMGINGRRAHFMSLCVKAAYEDEAMFRDIVKEDWKRFEYLKMLATEDKDHGGPQERQRQIAAQFNCDRKLAATKAQAIDSFIPQTRAHVITNDHAVILAFRGTEPTNLVQWATDATVELSGQKEVKGKVHEGFHAALFHRSRNSDGSYSSVALFQRICEKLAEALACGEKKSLYVTGHSLGGALVSVFAHCLAKLAVDKDIPDWDKGPEIVKLLMARVIDGGGIYTFAGPLVGDDEFRTSSQMSFGANIFRIVHAGDWVPQVPPYNLGYRHHTREFFLTSFGELCDDPDDIEHWRRLEHAPLSFLVLYIYKMVKGLSCRHESPVRTLERLLFLFIAPGLTDHWPSDYEFCLRKLCLNRLRDVAQPTGEPKQVVVPASSPASLDNHQQPMPTHELDFQAEVPAAQAARTNDLEQA